MLQALKVMAFGLLLSLLAMAMQGFGYWINSRIGSPARPFLLATAARLERVGGWLLVIGMCVAVGAMLAAGIINKFPGAYR